MARGSGELAGYRSVREIHRSLDIVVHRATREGDGAAVILKALAPSSTDPLARRRLRHEYQILRELDVPGVVRVHRLRSTALGMTLELEDAGGSPLRAPAGGMPVDDVLALAVRLARIVAGIHAGGVTHRDLSPGNIVHDPASGALQIIDFGAATRLSHEARERSGPGRVEGTLGYLSPEQTGRMNRPVDRRTDLYSLGAVLYELLCGCPPFVIDDPLALIHATVARTPVPAHELRPDVPRLLSSVVSKLLSKMAEDRYQSAAGLAADLEACGRRGAAPEIALGTADRSDHFALPEKLYGRAAPLEVLVSAVAAARAGEAVAVAVLGPAGAGKTALVNELRRTLSDGGGHLAVGKFDQLRRTQPYAAVLRALRGLVQAILAESDLGMAAWRRRLLDAFGQSGALVLDAIPELEPIIGPQPPAMALPPTEARRRFLRVMMAFIQALHAPERPLLLFLDDVQWADPASLELIERMLVDEGRARAALILSWRSGEVDDLHPLTAVLSRVPEGVLQRVELRPLRDGDITDLLVDALGPPRDEVAALAALVRSKTEGNPFFVREFLKALHQQGGLRFDASAGRWTWHLDDIRRLAITDNVVALLSRRLRELPDETREVLSIAACIGNRFELQGIAVASRRTRGAAARALWPALVAGLLVPTDDPGSAPPEPTYATFDETDETPLFEGALLFAHDRVQQAAYELLSEDERRRVHLEIGRLFLAHFADGGEDRVFDIVAQLNVGLDLIEDPAERRRVAELDLLAGRKATASAAFGAALTYFEAGVSLLDASAWTDAYDLALALHLGAGEAALMCPDRPTVIDHVEAALAHAASVHDKVEAQDIRIKHHLSRYESPRALERTLEALRWLGVTLPERPTKLHVAAELGRTWWRLRELDLAALRALPEAKDEAVITAMRLLLRSSSAAYYGSSNLMPLFFLRTVNLALDHGVSKFSAWGFVGYALVLAARFDDVVGAERFGAFARELVDRFDAADLRPRVDFMYYGFIQYRSHPIGAVIDAYPPLYHLGIEAGDLEAAGFAAFGHANRSFLAGVELAEVDERAGRQVEAIRRVGQEKIVNIALLLRQVVANLRGQAKDPRRLDGEHIAPAAYLRLLREADDKSNLALYHAYRCMLEFLFGSPDEAVRELEASRSLGAPNLGAIQSCLFNLYAVLARVALARRRSGWEARRLLRAARADAGAIRKWAVDAPMNFLHHQRLAEAEIAAAEGRDGEAARLYDEGIAGARSSDATHETALGLELAARFYLARRRYRSVAPYLSEARAAWTQWGALARLPVIDALEVDLRRAYAPPAQAPGPAGGLGAASRSRELNDAELNLASVMKASRAVSGELVLQRLSERLMRVILENAGARQGLLAIERGGELSIAARGQVEGAEVAVEVPVVPVPIATPGAAPPHAVKLLHYAARTREPVASDDAGDGRLRDLTGGAVPLSVLCVPLVKGQQLVGLIYLDNDLTAGAFTADRMELISLLAAQAALSIQNAVLYAALEEHSRDLEQKVEERTHDLKAKNDELALTLSQLRETQMQLVVQERLASLGALTAGIAHEMKNPLNFVTNFAQLSADLSADLAASLATQRDRLDDEVLADVDDLLESLRGNVTKINEHGRRAGRIIDGMLLHSQGAAGAREQADLNAILAESVQFARQRARTQYPRCEITLVVTHDASIGLIELSPLDIRRVFISVVENACYAVQKRQASAGAGFSPRLEVRSVDLGDRVEVRIRDNGVGIPPAIADKVWNPFFTTKPTDQGVGLGLSIAHEIVVRGHRGEIRFSSTEGELTEFVIELPRRAAGPSDPAAKLA
jgi:predicted ATPase/signal transduction histidine kinase